MTIVSSGALALQDLGTNTSSTVDNVRLTTSFTAGVDGLLQIKRQQEVDDGVFVDVNVWQGDAYGYNLGMFSIYPIHNVFDLDVGSTFGNVKYASVSNFGALGTTGYSSADGTSRTIGGVFWGLPDASPNNVRLFIFALNGTGITNTDTAAWSKIEVTTNGGTTVTINRSDLSYDSSENGDSWWYFSGSSGTVYNAIGSLGTPSSSAYTIKVIGGTTSATTNNGIAEEFGGDDSSNVKMSDYYKNGGSAVPPFVSSSVTASIPTSGQIKFSDFYGATDVPAVTSAVEIQPAAKYEIITGPRGGNYEHILHGFGPTYTNTYATQLIGFNSAIAVSTKTDSAQGSLIGSPSTNVWGVSSSIGTLRALLHFTYGPSGSSHGVMMIVESTGSNSNSGFTNLTITRSGMTTLTLPRSSATYTYVSSGTARIWRWNSSQVSAIASYRSGSPASANVDSLLFPGGSGSGSANTTTSSRSTWTLS